ncbi:hypothetical protein EVAR_73471_1 [Eumeta japonica]|uniref:Uncharacterized protein n=1 Tax=Eumeta variegata TaxID=151549 RepID=A0A4C1T7J5_EUMVA|nr:hypothetical protein EVAR_73471_1 [Eumeta japonica]
MQTKLSTSTDGDSTNYELIEYLKRREKRDEELLRRMDAREERLVSLLERTVMAIESIVQHKCLHQTTSHHKLTDNAGKMCNGNAATPSEATTVVNTSESADASAAAATAASDATNETSEKTKLTAIYLFYEN